ncbi:multiple inositol polyphosphate phosphatase 1-like isoform X2 [Homarus americanus]|nr:multiple inositol polyphosphate phosphatase 1-like isoform X2 [Homarus americanus]
MWLLNRHGTRYPTQNDIGSLMNTLPSMSQQIEANHHQGRGCLRQEDLEQISNWFPPYSSRDKEQLQEVGYDELFSIGEYWRNMFPHLFNVTYDPAKFKVDYTVKNRTGQSAYHFFRGMFGEDAVGNIEFPQPYSPNFILRFYKACPRWLREVYKNNETTYKERRLFVQTEEFQSMAHAVSARLGFMHPLKPREIVAIYDECRYETAWWPARRSAWCSAFSPSDFEVMEYHQDLKYYYEDSYGHPLNSKTACRTLADLYTNMRMTVNNGVAKPQGIFYFAHDKTIFKVLAGLGLFRPPQHLKHNNFAEMRNRYWRTSFVSPFSANVAFVLYRCGLEFKVGTFFQGQPTPLKEICQGVTCRWEEISPWLNENYKTCDLSKLCMMHDEL